LRSLAGLHLLGLNERALHVHPNAVAKDAEFRAASEAARGSVSHLDAADLARRQEAFLAANGARAQLRDMVPSGRPKGAGYPKSYEVAAMREIHGKAYAPWTQAEETDLKRRHKAGETVDAIAAQLGRKPGAIRSRLKKLELI
jgi:ATP-dependent DNA helicase PIF1